MKKFIALALSILCLAAFCSCGKSIKFEHGVTEGDVYTNKSLDVKFTKPSDWVFKTDEEIAELMEVSVEDYIKSDEMIDSGELAEATEFVAVDNTTGDNVIMAVEKISRLINEERYIKIFKENLTKEMSGNGSTITISDEQTEVDLGGNKYIHLNSVIETSGVTMYQNYYIRKVGNFIVAISTTSLTNSDSSYYEKMIGKAE